MGVMSGEGTLYSPYVFKLLTSNDGVIKDNNSQHANMRNLKEAAISFGILAFVGLTTTCGVIVGGRKGIFPLLMLLIILIASCCGQIKNEWDKSFVIVHSSAKQISLINDRIDDLFNGAEDIKLLNNIGKDIKKDVIKNKHKPETEVEYMEFVKELNMESISVAKEGEYRLTTMKQEIDGVFAKTNYISMNLSIEEAIASPNLEEFRESFISENADRYNKGDYEDIIKYIEENDAIIFHLYDINPFIDNRRLVERLQS